jgi:hypothetical protein
VVAHCHRSNISLLSAIRKSQTYFP